jgi:hypothetical protein
LCSSFSSQSVEGCRCNRCFELYRASYVGVNSVRDIQNQKLAWLLLIEVIKAARHLIEVDEAVIAGIHDGVASAVHIDANASSFLLSDEHVNLTSLEGLEQLRAC